LRKGLAIFGAALALASVSEGALVSLAAQQAEFRQLDPEEVHFKSPFGSGPESVVIFGDPSKPGLYVVRNRFPPGVHSFPHFHTKDRHVTVIKGVWWAGTGPELDFNKARPLKAGAYMFHPAGGVHWDGAGGKEETIVQIIGEGPVETTPVTTPQTDKGYWPKAE
jgi:quercetin dioxygenase-like cupin family protein